MLLLATSLIFSAAGAAAIDASLENSRDTYTNSTSDPANATAPGVVDLGEDAGSTLATLLPLAGFVAVPLGIVGLLGLGLTRRSRSGRRRR